MVLGIVDLPTGAVDVLVVNNADLRGEADTPNRSLADSFDALVIPTTNLSGSAGTAGIANGILAESVDAIVTNGAKVVTSSHVLPPR